MIKNSRTVKVARMDNTLAKRLKNLRESKDMTQLELAKILNISNSALSQYESGNRTPGDDIKKKICDFFNVSLDYLLGRSATEKINDPRIETKAFHTIDIEGLSDEAVKQIEDYIDYIKNRYNPDGTKK